MKVKAGYLDKYTACSVHAQVTKIVFHLKLRLADISHYFKDGRVVEVSEGLVGGSSARNQQLVTLTFVIFI